MNRKQLQQLAETRLEEAESLLRAGHPSGAYYLAGYAVECALKACIARKTQMHEFPDRVRVNNSYTRSLEKLIGVAGLEKALKSKITSSSAFKMNWGAAKDWSEEARYSKHSRTEAQSLVQAIGDAGNGVLTWLKSRW